jgi:hypothetical protein
MATDKKSFILYCDQKGVWDKLDNEQAGRLIKHVIAYVNDDNPVAPDFITELAFEPIKAVLKRDLKKWETQQEQRKKAGKKSAEVRKRNATSVNERSIPSTVNGSVSVNVNDISIGTDFDAFFKAYGKQVDKIPCQREWLNIEREEHAKILEHVSKYVNSTPDVKFRKKPLNYLKDRTWLDPELPNATKKEKFKPNLI